MSKAPIFSFVVPVYKKAPEVFERCLKHLFDMSLKEIEVIAVFDGKDKELEAVAKGFPKVQSLVIEHGGASKARNAGSCIAKGRYIACWDADCFAKPEMAKRWLEEFEAVPTADFVYTGYEIAGEHGGFDSEPFDAYSLTCGNYISSMAPIKREKAPQWDESLPAGQDWDFWLTAVENGCQGSFIPGAGFVTDTSGDGISSGAWSPEKREETIRRVREKHGIGNREIGVYSHNYTQRALKLAKLLGGDLIKMTGLPPTTYKMVFNFGYGFLSRFEGIAPEVTKIQYWVPGEIEGLAQAPYKTVMETIRIAKGVINLCNTQYEMNQLSELGITAEVVSLALLEEDTKKVQTELPKEFSILVVCDAAYEPLLKDLPIELPHIKIGFHNGKAEEFSCLLSFYRFATVEEPILMAHVNGRNVISNVQAPFCGYIDPAQSVEDFKKELFQRIRETRSKGLNKEAQAYYLQLANAGKFKEKILSLMPAPKLEVIQ